MCEPLDSRLLPEGKGSLCAGDGHRGTPPSMPDVGETRSCGGWDIHGGKENALRSTSSPLTEPKSELRLTGASSA